VGRRRSTGRGRRPRSRWRLGPAGTASCGRGELARLGGGRQVGKAAPGSKALPNAPRPRPVPSPPPHRHLLICPYPPPGRALQSELERNKCRPKSIDVWQRGVDTDVFHPRHRSAEMRVRLSDGHPEAPLLVYVGRLGAGGEGRGWWGALDGWGGRPCEGLLGEGLDGPAQARGKQARPGHTRSSGAAMQRGCTAASRDTDRALAIAHTLTSSPRQPMPSGPPLREKRGSSQVCARGDSRHAAGARGRWPTARGAGEDV
jgi:hypothetical protein